MLGQSISKMQNVALPKWLHDTCALVLILCKLGGSSCQKCCPTEKLGSFSKCSKEILGKEILHISAIMSFGLNGSASWVTDQHLCTTFCTFILFLPNWSEPCIESRALLSRLLFQAAAKSAAVLKSCRLMFTLNMRLKRCKMSATKKLKSQLR